MLDCETRRFRERERGRSPSLWLCLLILFLSALWALLDRRRTSEEVDSSCMDRSNPVKEALLPLLFRRRLRLLLLDRARRSLLWWPSSSKRFPLLLPRLGVALWCSLWVVRGGGSGLAKPGEENLGSFRCRALAVGEWRAGMLTTLREALTGDKGAESLSASLPFWFNQPESSRDELRLFLWDFRDDFLVLEEEDDFLSFLRSSFKTGRLVKLGWLVIPPCCCW